MRLEASVAVVVVVAEAESPEAVSQPQRDALVAPVDTQTYTWDRSDTGVQCTKKIFAIQNSATINGESDCCKLHIYPVPSAFDEMRADKVCTTVAPAHAFKRSCKERGIHRDTLSKENTKLSMELQQWYMKPVR